MTLDSCGGYYGDEGVDCITAEGALDVACVKGKCQPSKCAKSYTKVNGQCVRDYTVDIELSVFTLLGTLHKQFQQISLSIASNVIWTLYHHTLTEIK